MRDVKIGAPGYILLADMARDMKGTLKKVGELGYDGIELTGFFGKTAEEIRTACEEAGLEPFGCYVLASDILGVAPSSTAGNWGDFAKAFAALGDTPDERMQYIRDIGCTYVGLLTPNEPQTQGHLDNINRVAELARKYGMQLQFHNHDYEFNNMVNGETRLEQIMKNTSVLYEPDLGWIGIAGVDPMEQLRQYADRIQIVHAKDYFRSGNVYDSKLPYVFRPTGYGVMDWAQILPLCEELIVPKWYVADHDKAYDGDIYQELKMSLDYLRLQLFYC